MKSFPSTSLALAFACVAGLAACHRPTAELTSVSHQARATGEEKGATAEDALITDQVKSALAETEDIDGKDIQVRTVAGQVTLTGRIPARQIERAEEVARDVDGVRDVDNQLKPVGVMT
ncbi:MAG TPA: BON domain-containing protein [Rhodocyclaceae bacterium]|nr:BON domain-containing protein [Rhodocyclaceae bacterium]